jgi:hypothetical protein
MSTRRNRDAGFKARVASEAVNGERILSELSAEILRASDDDPPMEEGSARGGVGHLRARREEEGGGQRGDDAVAAHQDRRAGRRMGFFVTKPQALDRQVRRGTIERSHPTL